MTMVLGGKWAGKKGVDAVVAYDVELDKRSDGGLRVSYLWHAVSGSQGGVSCCDLAHFLRNYTRQDATVAIDYSLVYIGLRNIGRMPRGRVVDYSDAKLLIDLGCDALIRLAPGDDRDAHIAALGAMLIPAAA